jgi:histidine ammonia-lyase
VSSVALTPEQVVAVARQDVQVALGTEAQDAMQPSAEIVAQHAERDVPVYGVSTGFGSLAATPIAAARRGELPGADAVARGPRAPAAGRALQ